MQDTRTVIEVAAPPEPPMPGSSWIGVVLFPVFAIVGLILGFAYAMPWLITSSLAISLALLAVVGSTFLNRHQRAGKLRLDLDGGAVRIGPGPLALWFPVVASSLAMVAILVDITLRLTGYFADENGLTFSLLIALVVGWGLLDGWYGLRNPAGLKLSPSHLTTVAGMGKESEFAWSTVTAAPSVARGRITIPVGKGETQVAVNQIDSDARLVMALIEAYRKSPARRSELGDGRVVDRARSLTVG